MAAFCIAATLKAVYWPRDVQPDGGRGVIDGAGWAPVGLMLACIFVWWNFTDAMKYIVWKVSLLVHESCTCCGYARECDLQHGCVSGGQLVMSLRRIAFCILQCLSQAKLGSYRFH